MREQSRVFGNNLQLYVKRAGLGIEEFAEKLLPYARLLNTDMVWTNAAVTVHESTLSHSLNMLGVPTMVLEMGVGTRIDRKYGNQVVEGIFHLIPSPLFFQVEPKVPSGGQHPISRNLHRRGSGLYPGKRNRSVPPSHSP